MLGRFVSRRIKTRITGELHSADSQLVSLPRGTFFFPSLFRLITEETISTEIYKLRYLGNLLLQLRLHIVAKELSGK